MNGTNRKFLSFVLTLALLAGLCRGVYRFPDIENAEEPEAVVFSPEEEEALAREAYEEAEKTVIFWYCSPRMTPFLTRCGLDFYRESGIAVGFEEKEELFFVEQLYDASIAEEKAPDGYLIGADALEEVVLLGLAEENPYAAELGLLSDSEESDFAEAARTAATLRGEVYGYPVYFETPVFVYLTEAFDEAPVSIQGMLDFVAENELSITVGNLIEWDLDDEFYDLALVGDCFTFSDEEVGTLTVTVDEARLAEKKAFLSALSESITLDVDTISEGTVVSRLNHRATASAIVDSSDLAALTVPYAVCTPLPLNESLTASGCASTELLLVNGFSEEKEAASEFARFVSTEAQSYLHELTPHFAASRAVNTSDEEQIVYAAYEEAAAMPHSMDSATFLKKLRLEILKNF